MTNPRFAPILVATRRKGKTMDHKHDSLMDSTGLGLLPGVALALMLAMLATAALLLDTYWALALVLAVVVGAGVAITWVVLALAGEDDDEGRMRDAIPGLGRR
jgi:hypothetical protein